MPTRIPVWAEPRYRRFFDGAEQTIAREHRIQARPALAVEEQYFHDLILEVCGVEMEEPALAWSDRCLPHPPEIEELIGSP